MHGYRGDAFDTIYALVYSPVPRFSQKQVESQLEEVRADRKWKMIAVHGPGGRRRGEGD